MFATIKPGVGEREVGLPRVGDGASEVDVLDLVGAQVQLPKDALRKSETTSDTNSSACAGSKAYERMLFATSLRMPSAIPWPRPYQTTTSRRG
jgi:hypothetical protein